MVRGFGRLALLAAMGSAVPATAQMYWQSPDFHGAPVTGDEATVVIPLPGATDAEKRANLIWTMRAGLNVAALQCQFAPSLMTVTNYNELLKHDGGELADTYKVLGNYFKRVAPKGTSASAIGIALDQYTTRTYNSFSTLNAQISFCQVASSIGQQALQSPKGALAGIARDRLAEFRNALKPQGDLFFARGAPQLAAAAVPDLAPSCYDKKGLVKPKCLRN